MSVDPNRRARIQTLIEQGATEGERAAARAALGRLDTRLPTQKQRHSHAGTHSRFTRSKA